MDQISLVFRPDHHKTQASYDRISKWYDVLEGNWEKPAREAGLRQLAAAPGEQMLEIGPGTGSACLALVRSLSPNGMVIGVDLSMGMLRTARCLIQKRHATGKVFFSAGDARLLPIRTASIDAIYCSFTLELFSEAEIPLVLEECRRALKPGGRICIVALTSAGGPSLARRLYEWFHLKLPDLVDCLPIFVKDNLENTGYIIKNCHYTHLWRIPVEIVLATTPRNSEREPL